MKNEIDLSKSTELNDDSYEIIRTWITSGNGSHVWISAWALEGERSFGHLLSDIARHGAKAYATTYEMDETEAMQNIVDGLMEELRDQISDVEMINPGELN